MYLNAPLTEHEIIKCINNLKNSKASSPSDNILNEYIKSTKEILIPFYCKLFNCIIDTGIIPQTWLEGTIIPIFKNKGDPKDPNNYRPITILSCLGKLFTSVLNQRLTQFLENNNLLDENQAGFRKGYSCSDHIFTLHSLIEILKKRKQKLYCAFIDFSQAFDKVWRVGLWHKLLKTSINGKFFNIIFSMYSNIKSCISHNGTVSPTFISEIGVRQGENLSPLLFSLFLNDMQSSLNLNGSVGVELNDPLDLTLWLKLLILLYADDTILLSDCQNDFQNSLNTFHEYCNNWHLNINYNKTKIIIFGARQLQNFNFYIGNTPIEITDNYHYLGLTFSSNGSFLKARKHIAEQATKAMHLLFTRANNASLPIDLIIKLFDHTVLPILTYGSEIFGYENIDILERIHNKFLRKITYAKTSTPISFLHGELGRYPISITIQAKMISFWTRILNGKQNKFAAQIYNYMMILPDNNFKWINKIKEILNATGFIDLWHNQHQLNTTIKTNKIIKNKLIEQYKATWQNSLTTSNKTRTYRIFKENLELEKYLTLLPQRERSSLFKIRTANHNLPVETGRYDGTPYAERKCTKCTNDQVGSEEHYILFCPYLQTQREQYLSVFNTPTSNLTLKTVLSTTSTTQLKEVCKFLNIILQSFKQQ